jgi:type I restriction enzyme S subunit
MKIGFTKMAELIEEISMGPFGSDIKIDNFIADGVPVLNGSNLTKFKLIEDQFKYVSEEKAITFKKAIAKRGDIVITHRGTLGQISYIPDNSKYDKYVISQSQFKVRLKKDLVDPSFFVYYFHTNEGQKRLLANKCHVGVPALAQATTNFRLIEFPLPKLESQQKIANVLSSLDAKIELNNRINAELEAMAKTLYNYWFVQFNFPFDFAQGKQNTEGKPYKSSGGKMIWNEELKREIPEGWEVGELNEIANIKMGQSPPGESYNNEGKGMVFYQGCTDFGNRFPTIRLYTTQPSRFAKNGDILLSVRAPVGTLNIAKEDCCIGRGLATLNSKDNCIAYLFGVMLNLKQIFDRRNVDGTTFGSITKDDLFSLKVIMPNKDILEQYHNLINPAFEKQNIIALENIELSSLRDWLLPMLMNGQVTVNEQLGISNEKLGDSNEQFAKQDAGASGLMAAEDGVEYGK